MEKIILDSGREVEYTKPNFRNRTKIWDRFIKDGKDGTPITLEHCMDIMLCCKVATEEQLDNDEFTIKDLYEIGGHLLNEFWATELDKKKLK